MVKLNTLRQNRHLQTAVVMTVKSDFDYFLDANQDFFSNISEIHHFSQ